MPLTKPSYSTPPVLCIDASYLLFYRLNALKVWYKHANGEAPSKEAINSSGYQQKLCDRIDATLSELIRRHRPSVVVLAFDGHQNWRRAFDDQYKATRNHEALTLRLFGVGHKHLKSKYCDDMLPTGATPTTTTCTVHCEWPLVCEHTPETWTAFSKQTPRTKNSAVTDPKPSSRMRRSPAPSPNIITLHHDNLEADDIVHYLTRRVASPKQPVVIVASDHDYLPLLDFPQVYLNKLPNTPITLPDTVRTGEEFLMLKILLGDKSDNVPPVFAKKPKLNKKSALVLAQHPEQLRKRLAESDDDTQSRFERNRVLVDNRHVPEHLQAWLHQWMDVLQATGRLPRNGTSSTTNASTTKDEEDTLMSTGAGH